MKTKKLHMDPLDLTALCNGLVFFAPVALLVRSTAGVSTEQFFVLQALLSAVVLAAEVPSGWLTDRIGCQRTLVLYQLTNLGAKGLLLGATTVVSALGAAAAFRLQPEPPCPAAQLDRRPRGLGLGELLRTGPVAALMLLLAALSMGRLLVNFFYVEKLTACGLPESWMGPLILGYAGLELLCPRILGRIRQGRGLVGALILSGMVLGLLGLSLPRWGTVALMLVLPLLLDLASCLLDQAENDQIDRLGRQEQRAELLSLFNMGVNLLEMAFLLGSSAVSALGSGVCFGVVGIGLAAAGLVCAVPQIQRKRG